MHTNQLKCSPGFSPRRCDSSQCDNFSKVNLIIAFIERGITGTKWHGPSIILREFFKILYPAGKNPPELDFTFFCRVSDIVLKKT
jgi:hypothetical protein